jgi:Uma2 family endonuclease
MGFTLPWLVERDDSPVEDHVVFLRGATWADYERILEIRGDRSAPRISYADGVIEIMSPSRDHENLKSLIGCLVEAYCFERDIRFTTVGSWTLKTEKDRKGAEPDECYIFGDGSAERPDLVIEGRALPAPPTLRATAGPTASDLWRRYASAEPSIVGRVVWTSGRLDKLAIYRKLGIREVWYFEGGVLQPYALRRGRYVKVHGSEVLPDLDLAELVSFLDRPTTYDAVRDYRAALGPT